MACVSQHRASAGSHTDPVRRHQARDAHGGGLVCPSSGQPLRARQNVKRAKATLPKIYYLIARSVPPCGAWTLHALITPFIVPYRCSQKHPFSAHEGRPRQNSLSLIAANPHHFLLIWLALLILTRGGHLAVYTISCALIVNRLRGGPQEAVLRKNKIRI